MVRGGMGVAGVAIVAAVMLAAQASGQGAAERRELGPHAHGHGTLDVAIEAGSVRMELHAPGDDIVGFEYTAKTPEDKAKVAAAMATLKDVVALLAIPAAAQCRVVTANVAVAAEELDDDEKAAQAAGVAAGRPPEEHSEFRAEYELTCAQPRQLRGFNTATYFAKFPNAEDLDVSIITTKGQAAFEANRAHPVITLGPGLL